MSAPLTGREIRELSALREACPTPQQIVSIEEGSLPGTFGVVINGVRKVYTSDQLRQLYEIVWRMWK